MTRLSVRRFSDRIEVIDSDGFFGPSWMTIHRDQYKDAKPGDKMTVIRNGRSITFDLVEPKSDRRDLHTVREYYTQIQDETADQLYQRWEHGRRHPPGWHNKTEEEKRATVRSLRPGRPTGRRNRNER